MKNDALLLHSVEMLRNKVVVCKLRTVLLPLVLADKIHTISTKIARDYTHIAAPEAQVGSLETECDQLSLRQYFCCPNLWFHGIVEIGDGVNTIARVLAIFNSTMAVTPPPVRDNGFLISYRFVWAFYRGVGPLCRCRTTIGSTSTDVGCFWGYFRDMLGMVIYSQIALGISWRPKHGYLASYDNHLNSSPMISIMLL